MKLIPLSNKHKDSKHAGKSAKVDDSDYLDLVKYNWSVSEDKKNGCLYAYSKINGKSTPMHRFILKIKDGKIKVDHKDRDGINNQRNNLRESTHRQNCQNRRSAKNSSSKYLGVEFKKSSRNYINKHGISVTKTYTRWTARIKHNGKDCFLGSFATEELAAVAYDEAAKEFHGEFSNLNFK